MIHGATETYSTLVTHTWTQGWIDDTFAKLDSISATYPNLAAANQETKNWINEEMLGATPNRPANEVTSIINEYWDWLNGADNGASLGIPPWWVGNEEYANDPDPSSPPLTWAESLFRSLPDWLLNTKKN